MAISISTGHLVPHVSRGNPYVVVKGTFRLGLCRTEAYYQLASRLFLRSAAAASGSGTFSMTVAGRCSSYAGGPYFTNNKQLSDYSVDGIRDTNDVASGDSSAYGYPGHDMSGSVRMIGDGADTLSCSSATGEDFSDDWKRCLGKAVSAGVTIVFRGKLARLDLSQVKAFAMGHASYSSYFYNESGWTLDGVHVYDQPFRSVGLPSGFDRGQVQWD